MSGTGLNDAARSALALLMAVAEPGDPRVGAALDRWGARDLIDRVREGGGGFPGARAMRLRLEAVSGAEQLARAGSVGAMLVARGDPDWPTQLDDLGPGRPYGLWTHGSIALRPALLRSVA
ncbi:MAG: DNA-protecting protein DprA, partial [Sporichthya sp.]